MFSTYKLRKGQMTGNWMLVSYETSHSKVFQVPNGDSKAGHRETNHYQMYLTV